MNQAALLHSLDPAVLTIDATEAIVALNGAAEALFGWPAADLLGRPVATLIPQRFRSRHHTSFAALRVQESLRQRVFGGPIQATGQRRSGAEFPLELRISPAVGDGQRTQESGYRVEVRDLSPISEAQAQISQLKRRFRDLVGQLPGPACIVEDAQLLYANAAFAALLGRPDVASVHDVHLADVLSPMTIRALAARAQALVAGETVSTSLTDSIALPGGQRCAVELRTLLMDASQASLLVLLSPLPPSSASSLGGMASGGTLSATSHPTHSPSAGSAGSMRGQGAIRFESAPGHQHVELRELSDRLMEAREDERRRIARELHDELGQQLSALKLTLVAISQAGALQDAAQQAQVAQQVIDDIVRATRRIAADLRPLMLDDLGLNSAIEWLAREVEKRGKLRICLQVDPFGEWVGEPQATGLYRMVQEALTNVERHAQASEATVELRRTSHEICLCVRDNGVGFTIGATRKSGSYGLLGLRERARMLGGVLEIDNLPAGGGSVSVRLPIGHHIAP